MSLSRSSENLEMLSKSSKSLYGRGSSRLQTESMRVHTSKYLQIDSANRTAITFGGVSSRSFHLLLNINIFLFRDSSDTETDTQSSHHPADEDTYSTTQFTTAINYGTSRRAWMR